MKEFLDKNFFLVGVVSAVILVFAMFKFLNYKMDQSQAAMIETVVFNECVETASDIEMRRVCGRFAKAYANGKQDYQAWGKTLTWDEEARTYVIKAEK